ncbi:MAG: hypothetical protein KAR83_08510, partial [Thermodesulfovibrionales bacterium]|nr:hypothetical protein [Thermodesulfovibrionales bacterium]
MECKELIIDYIGRELRQVALKILPKKQVKYLSTSQSNLLEYVYVIEKYLSTRVLPVKYDVFYSSKVKKQDKYIENKNRIDTFVSYLKDADLRINSPSENYLPRSYKTFLSANPNQSDKYRYNPDVLNDY